MCCVLLIRSVTNRFNQRKIVITQSRGCPEVGLRIPAVGPLMASRVRCTLGSASALTWCSRPEGGAGGPSGRRPCPSSPRYAGPSTADAPGQWCRQCATGSSSGTHQGLSLISPPVYTTQQGTESGERMNCISSLLCYVNCQKFCVHILTKHF